MRPDRKSIVILSVSAGTGHLRAAEALKKAFQEECPYFDVTILDTFRYTSPFLEKLVLGAYMEMIKYTPSLYGYIYSRSEKGQPLSGLAKDEFTRILNRFSSTRLVKYIEEHNPEAVICTHPFPLGMLSSLRRSGDLDYFTVGVITDLTIHPYWVFPYVDLYLVGDGKLADDLAGFGIPPQKIYATGIPIDPFFGAYVDRKSVLGGLGLDYGRTTILVMGGGLGLGPLAYSVRELGNIEHGCQLIVVTGKNTPVKEKIDRLAPGLKNPVRTLGYVGNVHQLMACSDLMVSKPGGLSCSEALACGLPTFLLGAVPGQEERNSSFLTSAGASVAVCGVRDLGGVVSECLRHPWRLKEMSDSAVRLGRPYSAIAAARVINSSVSFRNGPEAHLSAGPPEYRGNH
ncbi:MAG: MGDG synthase family glycosyltransferase [Desulfocucumaceae bacterium]